MSILLGAILCTNVILLLAVLLVMRRVSRIYGQVVSFLSSSDPKTPSALAQTWEIAASMLSRSIMAGLKATLMAGQSAAVRGEKAVDADIAVDTASQMGFGSILSMFPSLNKTLRRNPGLLDLALSKLMAKGAENGNGNGNGRSAGAAATFKL